jgi:hypothetical protein
MVLRQINSRGLKTRGLKKRRLKRALETNAGGQF